MKQIIVIGCGDYAKLLTYYIHTITNWKIVAYAADTAFLDKENYLGQPLVDIEKLPSIFPPTAYEAILGVGYRQMNSVRQAIYERMKAKNYRLPNLIHPTAIIEGKGMGDANTLLENVVVASGVTIGNNNIFWNGAIVAHDGCIGNHVLLSVGIALAGRVTVEDNCFLGIHSTLQNDITLGHHTLVGGGAFVDRDTKAYEVIVPARSQTLSGRSSLEFI